MRLLLILTVGLWVVTAALPSKPAPMKPLPELETEEGFARFYEKSPLGIVLYTSTNCADCGTVQAALEEAAKDVYAEVVTKSPADVALAKIALARIVHDVTEPASEQLYHRAPHYAPPVPSLGVVRFGKVVPHRWRSARLDRATIRQQLLTLVRRAFTTVSTVAEMQAIVPHPTGFGTPAPKGQALLNASIVIVGLFPVASALQAELQDAAEYFKDTPNVRVVTSRSAEVAVYFNQPTNRGSVGVFNEGRPEAGPHWHHVNTAPPPGTACTRGGGDSATEAACSSATSVGMDLRGFLAVYARPWVDLLGPEQPPAFPDSSIRYTCIILVDDATVDFAVDAIAAEVRALVGDRVRVGVHHVYPHDENDMESPFGFTYGEVRKLHALGKVVYGVLGYEGERYAEGSYIVESPQQIATFIEVVRSGAVPPITRSEDGTSTPVSVVSTASSNGEVVTVVGKTFNAIVLDDTRNVLLLIVGDTCDDECRRVEHIFTDLAHAYRNEPDVVIARVNLDRNEIHRNYRRMSYPEITYAAKGFKQTPEWYALDVTFAQLWMFVAERQTMFTGKERIPARNSGRSSDEDDADELDQPRAKEHEGLEDYRGPSKSNKESSHRRRKRAARGQQPPPIWK
jgi:hypothetical protein